MKRFKRINSRPYESTKALLPSMHVIPSYAVIEQRQMSETGDIWIRPRKIDSVVFHWSRKQVGMTTSGAAGAWSALHRRTKHIPTIHKSSKSVASWRRRQGDITGVSVTLHGMKAAQTRRTVLWGLPMTKVVDLKNHSDKTFRRCTFTIEKPRRRPSLEPHYELLRTRASVPGLNVTVSMKEDHHGTSFLPITGNESRRGWLIQDRSNRPKDRKTKS